AMEGHIEHIESLLSLFHYHFKILAKAYCYALQRTVKLKPNLLIRNQFKNQITTVRQNRLNQLIKYNIKTDQTLLEQGEQCQLCDNKDQTTIIYVSPWLKRHQKLFELLLPYSDINIKVKNITMLYQCVQHNYFLGVNYLLSHGADPYITCLTTQSPLKISN